MTTEEIVDLCRKRYNNEEVAHDMIMNSIDMMQYAPGKDNNMKGPKRTSDVMYRVEAMSEQQNDSCNKLMAKLKACGYRTDESEDEISVTNRIVKNLCIMGMVTRPGTKVFMQENENDKTRPYIIFIFTGLDTNEYCILNWVFNEVSLSKDIDNIQECIGSLEDLGCKLTYDGDIEQLPIIGPQLRVFTSTLVSTGMYLNDYALVDVMRWVKYKSNQFMKDPDSAKMGLGNICKIGVICKRYITEYNAVFQTNEFTENPFSLDETHSSFDDILTVFVEELTDNYVNALYNGYPIKLRRYKRYTDRTKNVRKEINYIASCVIRNPQVLDDILNMRVNDIVYQSQRLVDDLENKSMDEACQMLGEQTCIIVSYIKWKFYDQIGPIMTYRIDSIKEKYDKLFQAALEDFYA